jgi:hypothetical protein
LAWSLLALTRYILFRASGGLFFVSPLRHRFLGFHVVVGRCHVAVSALVGRCRRCRGGDALDRQNDLVNGLIDRMRAPQEMPLTRG